MTDFEQQGRLILPADPTPTQAELTAPYYQQHSVCPQCGSPHVETTCIGYICFDPSLFRDDNRATCLGCGWVGTKHEMVPAKGPSC